MHTFTLHPSVHLMHEGLKVLQADMRPGHLLTLQPVSVYRYTCSVWSLFFHHGRDTTAQHFCTAVERIMPQLVCSVLGVSSSAESVALYSGGGILLGSCCLFFVFFLSLPCWNWQHFIRPSMSTCCNYHVIHTDSVLMVCHHKCNRRITGTPCCLILNGRHWNQHVPGVVVFSMPITVLYTTTLHSEHLFPS